MGKCGLYDQYAEVVAGAKGVSIQMAEKILETFWGQTQVLQSAISEVMIAVGEVLLPTTEKVIKTISVWIANLGKLASEHSKATKLIIGTVAAISALNVGILALKYAWLGIKLPFQTARVAFDLISLKALRNANAIAKAGKSAGLFSKIAGKLTAGVRGIGKAFSAIGSGISKAFSGIMNLGKSLISGLFSPLSLKIVLIAGLIAGLAAAAYLIYKNWDKLKAWWNSWTLKDIFAPVIGFVQKVCASVKQLWNDFWAWSADP